MLALNPSTLVEQEPLLPTAGSGWCLFSVYGVLPPSARRRFRGRTLV